MKVLAIDVGGTSVKILATGQKEPRKFPSGPDMDPKMMVQQVKKLAADWQYDVVSIGIPHHSCLATCSSIPIISPPDGSVSISSPLSDAR